MFSSFDRFLEFLYFFKSKLFSVQSKLEVNTKKTAKTAERDYYCLGTSGFIIAWARLGFFIVFIHTDDNNGNSLLLPGYFWVIIAFLGTPRGAPFGSSK